MVDDCQIPSYIKKVKFMDTAAKTKIFLPFASGNIVELVLSFHEDERSDRPLKPYPLYDAGVEMIRVADCAGEVAAWLTSLNKPLVQKYTVGYQLKELATDSAIIGSSGGLAMALGFYCELNSLDVGSFAATGELAGIRDDKVMVIEGVIGKLEGLRSCLNPGSKIFIPAENEANIPAELVERLALKEISLHPVTTVRQAIAFLSGDNSQAAMREDTTGSKLLKPLAVALALFFTIACAVWAIQHDQQKPLLEESSLEQEKNDPEPVVEPVAIDPGTVGEKTIPVIEETSDAPLPPPSPAKDNKFIFD